MHHLSIRMDDKLVELQMDCDHSRAITAIKSTDSEDFTPEIEERSDAKKILKTTGLIAKTIEYCASATHF